MPRLLDPLYGASRAYRLMMDMLETDTHADLDRLHAAAAGADRPSPEEWLRGAGAEFAAGVTRDALGGLHGDEVAALAYLRACEPEVGMFKPAA
jgi:hypothetical protein